jgi:hypothetical protein
VSTSLYWRPVPADPDGEYLGDQLKFVLARHWFDHDGSLSSEWVTVSKNLIPFLEGVRAVGGPTLLAESARLIDLLRCHDEIQRRSI